jgi:hypothetical protein
MHDAAPWKHLGTGDAYYRGMDAIALVRGRADMHAALRAEGQWHAYTTCVRDLDPILHRMTSAGVGVDASKVAGLEVDIARDMRAMQREMTALVRQVEDKPPGPRRAICATQTWKTRRAAEAGLARLIEAGECAPEAILEAVAAEGRTSQCGACGATGVTAPHVRKKWLDSRVAPAVES